MEQEIVQLFSELRDDYGVYQTVHRLHERGYSLKDVKATLQQEGYQPVIHRWLGVTTLCFNTEEQRLAHLRFRAAQDQYQLATLQNDPELLVESKDRATAAVATMTSLSLENQSLNWGGTRWNWLQNLRLF